MKKDLWILVLFIVGFESAIADTAIETRWGFVRRSTETVCSFQCDAYYLEPDPGSGFTFLRWGGDLSNFAGNHVEVSGSRGVCGGCSVFNVTIISLAPLTGLQETLSPMPRVDMLDQNYPNPFNPTTTIAFELARAGRAILSVADVLGRELARPVDTDMEPGRHSVLFDASVLSTGVFVVSLSLRETVQRRKMLLVK